jgi:Glycosyltransferase family 87
VTSARAATRRELWIAAALAIGAAIAWDWLFAWPIALDDYALEAARPFTALLHGHLSTFLRSAPPYGASLAMRAPLALIGSLSGASALLVYRLAALPCLLALSGLAAWIAVRLLAERRGWPTALAALTVCVANPITFYALNIGHPEEILGAALCVLAVLAAQRGRAALAGLLLGLAIANKEWGLVAAGPVLFALPERRLRAILIAGGVAAALIAPIALASPSLHALFERLTMARLGGLTTFRPQQVWWFFGTPGRWLHSMRGQLEPGYRTPPGWVENQAHLLILWLGLPVTLAAQRLRVARENALGLLAVLLGARCMLDPWDVVYYALPPILALASWETLTLGRAPLAAAIASIAAWAIFRYLPAHVNADVVALCFILASSAGLATLARSVFSAKQAAAARPPQSTTSSSLLNWLSRLAPSSPSSTRSSIRTPSAPGR